MIFRNRQDAAERLLRRLESYRLVCPLVLAIPRGAVPMGRVLAQGLKADLDVVFVRKIGAPGNEEYAVGSVSEYGDVYVGEGAERLGLDEKYLRTTADHELKTIARRRSLYTPRSQPLDPKARVVIIIDDGLATGSTMISAVRAVKSRHPAKIIVAVPVASRGALELLEAEGVEVVALSVPDDFYSVGQFYEDFSQVDDDEVRRALRAA